MKRGDILDGVMLRNEYTLTLASGTILTVISTSDFEQEWKVIDLPDGNSVPSKRSDPFEFDVEIPLHHSEEVAVIEEWISACELNGELGAQDVTLGIPASSNENQYTVNLEKCFPRKSSIPGKDAQSDEAANFKATIRCSSRGPAVYT